AAGILTKLLTIDGHLAIGSSVSPILSFFAYKDMFDEMNELAGGNECIMTCYVDDLAFTGAGANRFLIRKLIKILRCYGFFAHRIRLFKPGQPKIITGVAVTKSGYRVPNNRQRRIRIAKAQLAGMEFGEAKLALAGRLTSRIYEAAQIDSKWSTEAAAAAKAR